MVYRGVDGCGDAGEGQILDESVLPGLPWLWYQGERRRLEGTNGRYDVFSRHRANVSACLELALDNLVENIRELVYRCMVGGCVCMCNRADASIEA